MLIYCAQYMLSNVHWEGTGYKVQDDRFMAGGWGEKHYMPEAPASIVSDEFLVATKNPS